MPVARVRRLLRYSLLGAMGSAIVTTYLSLRCNDYSFDHIGIVRLSRAASTAFHISAMYRRKLYNHDVDVKSPEYDQMKKACHLYAAEKLLELCRTNKGVYIKVGQHIAALDYLLPKEYVQTMKVLHSRAPTSTLEDVYRVIREDLKGERSEVFATFDEQPLGVASLAQVHRATLKDGTVVAVKVQHLYVKGNTAVDMRTMEILVKICSWIFPEFKVQWLVDETKKNIPRELDFLEEGRNAERVAAMYKNLQWLKVPQIHWDLSADRVLTMEFVDGGQVNDLEYIEANRINPYEVTAKLAQLYARMIFINGFVHSDPHPGNILLRKSKGGDCEIILLDHGLYAELSRDFRSEYAQLWLSILNRDREGMRRHSKMLGIEGDIYGVLACMVSGRSWETILKGIDHKMGIKYEKETLQKVLPNILPDISGILQNVNRQMILVLKTNDLIRGIEHTLGTADRMGAFKTTSEYCIRNVYMDRFNRSTSRVAKLKILAAQRWYLFKLQVYYVAIYVSNWCASVFGADLFPI